MYAVLLLQVIPATATILPLYLVMRDLKLLNTVFVCPLTGQSYRPESNDHVLVVPTPYRL